MAQIATKKRRLNPKHSEPSVKQNQEISNAQRNTNQTVPEAVDIGEIEEDTDENEDIELNKPGIAYNALLKTLQKVNGKHVAYKQKHELNQDSKNTTAALPSRLENDNGEFGAEENTDYDQQEEERDPQATDEGLLQNLDDDDGDDDGEDSNDPFETHFANPARSLLGDAVESVKASRWETRDNHSTPVGRQSLVLPAISSPALTQYSHNGARKDMRLKKRLTEPSSAILKNSSSIQKAVKEPMVNYQDVMYCGRTPSTSHDLRNLACLHAINHILKTRDRIIKNTSRLGRNAKDQTLELRDQGFTRPKVLILLETRHACSRYMDSITRIFEPEQQENKKRFQDAFVQKDAPVSEGKPLDFRELFEGNDDNDFRLGIKFTRKTIRYYSPFYTSDIILASPLGLRRAMKPDDPKKADSDFLSSIELVIVDQVDAMLMQNWEHVEFVFENLNLQPKEAHDCDFSRVRYWYLDELAKYLRQTIVFSAYLTPELNGLFSSQMLNAAGKVKIIPDHIGVIQNMSMTVRQTFSRFRSQTPASDPDDRFKYFTNTIIPQLIRAAGPSGEGLGALVFIPSYLDFVRVRNYFSTSPDVRNITFGSISEYTDLPSSRRARSHFLAGRQSVMLYTGRAHHFRRYHIRGVKKVFLYGLPENQLFYNEIVGGFLASSTAEGILDPADATAKSMFSRWDGLALERIVGRERAGRMLKEQAGDTFEFR